jgi:indole-3-glycerol phosphate synthase
VSGFLDQMAASSTARYAAALAAVPLAEVRAAALARAPAPPLRLDGCFDLIAELKLRSPALGQLGTLQQDDALEQRVAAYARGGAAAVSVLTEPDRFDGSLDHLRRAVAVLNPLGVPAMRKDFLVAPYQLYEARAAGAGGALLIVRMLPAAVLEEMLDVAAELGLWILLEAFDEADIAVMNALVARRQTQKGLLLGVNSRDLQTLQVVPERLLTMAGLLPAHLPRVAESGVGNAADAAAMARAGWTMALVGTALMSATAGAEPLAQAMLAAARESREQAPSHKEIGALVGGSLLPTLPCGSELARDSGERL